MKQQIKTAWSWKAWLARIEEADIGILVKATGRAFARAATANGRKRCWIAAYELDGAWDAGNKVLQHLHALARQNLLLRQLGTPNFYPVLGPRLPKPGATRLDDESLSLLRAMLALGGRGLYYINRHGYLDQANAKPRWRLRDENACGGVRQPDRIIPARTAKRLARLGLVERNGCGHGWPFQWTSEFQVATHLLYAVADLPADLARHAAEAAP